MAIPETIKEWCEIHDYSAESYKLHAEFSETVEQCMKIKSNMTYLYSLAI